MSRELKDGPMACLKAQIQTYPTELKELRAGCLELLEDHETNTPDTIWQASDGPGEEPETETDRSLLKLATEVTTTTGAPTFPPKNTRLSDELVYLATKYLRATDRGKLYPYDFLARGDINPDRVPSGVAPIIWAHGLPFFPVFKGYYILCGRSHAFWIGWHLHNRTHRQMMSWPVWTIGPVVAPGSAVEESRSVERQARMWKMGSAKDCERGREKNCIARDVVSMAHMDGAVVPRDSKGGFFVTQLFRVLGYSVRVGPYADDGRKGTVQPRSFFTKNHIVDFDYNAAWDRPYRNWRKPQIYGDDDGVEEDEGESSSTDADGDTDMDEERKEQSVTDTEYVDGNSRCSGDKTEVESVESGEILECVNGKGVDSEMVKKDVPGCETVKDDQISPADEVRDSFNGLENEAQNEIQNEDGDLGVKDSEPCPI